MDYKKRAYAKKPLENIIGKQLFSYDVCCSGAKNFIFETYEYIYNIIKNNKFSYFYEDNTYATGIKLFIDIDEHVIFTSKLVRDKYADKIIDIILLQINTKLHNLLQIKKTSIIILISDTLSKLSLHIIYPDIIFNNMYEMKYFMSDIKIVDQSVYRIGCFRMMYCSKMGKFNKLIYNDSKNYNLPNSDFELFLDTCICYTNNKPKINIDIIANNIEKKVVNIAIYNNKIIERNYIYKNTNFSILKSSLNQLIDFTNYYMKWLIISFCIKDLYLSTTTDEQKIIYNLYDDFSKISNRYNKKENYKKFLSYEPRVDINYLFKMANEPYKILQFYDYQKLIFNSNKHKNIIIKNEKYINIDIDKLLKYKYIFIKSPCGTGKTYNLKEIIKKCNIKNLISITSRVNLASEHTKYLNLNFYLNLKSNDYDKCDRLVIQLESLKKCDYKLFIDSVVILDEINSLLSHLRSPTLQGRRTETYLYLVEIIKNAKYVISMDADLADWNIKFLLDIKDKDYIVYYNTIQNKKGTMAIIYQTPQTMIQIMVDKIINKEYFVSCFDSLKYMNKIINYLSKYGNKNEWLIYSSEVKYDLIDTNDWIDKFIFFTPSIIYGINFDQKPVDVFTFVYRNHLNSLHVYQMLSRARQQKQVHIYCNPKEGYVKYKTVDDLKYEIELYENNLGSMRTLYKYNIDIDDEAYRTMYYNYIYIDEILKSNIKEYLIDMLEKKGYEIIYNNTRELEKLEKLEIKKMNIKEKIIDLLLLDTNNLTELEKKLIAKNDKALEKHFNLRLLLKDRIDEKIEESILKNLYIETIKHKCTKIKICKEIMIILEIYKLEFLNKEVISKFNNILTNTWLKENLNIIKKTFQIRTSKYNNFIYYNIYTLLITLLKNLFDVNLFIRKLIKINNIQYKYYILNKEVLLEHIKIIEKINNSDLFINEDIIMDTRQT